jgi:uncharacterized repeat protein (TIGR01451 family)
MSIDNSFARLAPLSRPGRTARVVAGFVLLMGLAGLASSQSATSSAPAPAKPAVQSSQAVAVVLSQWKIVTDAQGKEQRVEASGVKPGDVLEYTATYTNRTSQAVSGLVADLPIPEGLEYLPRTARPGANLVKAATRDGVFAAEPLTRKVNGQTETVPYSDYRTLRWTLGQLPARGETAVTARAKVEAVVPPAPPASPPGKAP